MLINVKNNAQDREFIYLNSLNYSVLSLLFTVFLSIIYVSGNYIF